jgi:hypothetical protein
MLSLLLGLIPGALATVNGITNAIANERIAGLNATTQQDKIASDERVNTLLARRDALLAASHSPWTSVMQFMIALGPMIVLNKILIWDKALGDYTSGHTDSLDPNLWWVITATVGFYFLADTIKRFK